MGGMVSKTPGVKAMNRIMGTIKSAGVSVNLNPNLIIAHERIPSTSE
jgi:hypothetical protein